MLTIAQLGPEKQAINTLSMAAARQTDPLIVCRQTICYSKSQHLIITSPTPIVKMTTVSNRTEQETHTVNNKGQHSVHICTHLYCVIVVHVELGHIISPSNIHLLRVLMVKENIRMVHFIFQCTSAFRIWFLKTIKNFEKKKEKKARLNKLWSVGKISVSFFFFFCNVIK